MRKGDIDKFAQLRPFKPFEVLLVDGHRFRFRHLEEFMVSKYTLAALNKDGTISLIDLGLISLARPLRGRGTPHRRRPSRDN